MAHLLQSLDRHHFNVARDASSAVAADVSNTTPCLLHWHTTGPLAVPLSHPHSSSTAPAASCGSYLSPWMGTWDQQSLANYFNTMALTPPAVSDWVADSSASNHTTSDAGNLTYVGSPTFTDPPSIIIGNGSALLVTSIGDLALPSSFYLNNVLVTPDIIQNLLSIHHFTTDWCSMEFDPFVLSVKDPSTWNMIARCNSSGPLYTMHLPSHPAPSSPTSAPSALVASASTWHRRLSHPRYRCPV
jgi:hypothetical protein